MNDLEESRMLLEISSTCFKKALSIAKQESMGRIDDVIILPGKINDLSYFVVASVLPVVSLTR